MEGLESFNFKDGDYPGGRYIVHRRLGATDSSPFDNKFVRIKVHQVDILFSVFLLRLLMSLYIRILIVR
jgi:hypothetical protein